MENQSPSTSSSQIFIDNPPSTPNSQMPPATANPLGVAYPAPSPEVPQVPLIPAHFLDPRRGAALSGFVMGLIGFLALFAYVASFISTFIPSLRFLRPFTGFAICGSLVAAIVTPILGTIFSIRGLKSTTRKGLAISGLILSIIPLLMLLAICSLAFMVVWSNDTTPY